MPRFRFTVYGDVEPAGSKRAFVHPGSGRAIVTDANKKAKAWKGRVAQVAGENFNGELLTGPLDVCFTFYRPRLASHYGTGRNAGSLKESAPAYPITRPDALKLARGCEDALSGVVYRDDSQIVDEVLRKRWGSPARVEIEIEEM